MRAPVSIALIAATALSALGCQFIARDPARYERDTRALLEQNAPAISQCYETHLTTSKSAAGTVVVSFEVQQETGVIQKVRVDEAASTAAAPLQECVAKSITGLTLDPPDANTGVATFTYELVVGSSKAPADS